MRFFPSYTREEKIEELEKAIRSWANSFSVSRDTSKKIREAAKTIFLQETPIYSMEHEAKCQAEAAKRRKEREAEAARKKAWQVKRYGENDETRIAREMNQLGYLPAHFINIDSRLKSLYESVKKLVNDEMKEEEIEFNEKFVDKIIIDIIEQKAEEVMSDDPADEYQLEPDDPAREYDVVFDVYFEKSPGDIVKEVMNSIREFLKTEWD